MTDDPSIFRGLCERSWWQNLSPSLCLMTGRPFFYNGPAISRNPALLPTVGLVALIRTSFLPAPSPAPDQRPPFKRRQGNASRSPAPASRRTRGKWNDEMTILEGNEMTIRWRRAGGRCFRDGIRNSRADRRWQPRCLLHLLLLLLFLWHRKAFSFGMTFLEEARNLDLAWLWTSGSGDIGAMFMKGLVSRS